MALIPTQRGNSKRRRCLPPRDDEGCPEVRMNTRSLRSLSALRFGIGIGVALLASLPMIATPAGSPPAGDTARPTAPKVPHMLKLHDDTLQDEYFWLREKDNPKVRAYLEAENAYTDAYMKPTEPFQKALYDEMLSRIQETDLSVP